MRLLSIIVLIGVVRGEFINLIKLQQTGLTSTIRTGIDLIGKANITAIIAAANNTKNKFAATSRIIKHNVQLSHSKRGSSATIPLVDYGRDVLWSGTISVGSPGQIFTVDFDSGSSDFVLVRSTCTGTGCSVQGDGSVRRTYNAAGSTTAKVTTIAFANSYVAGGSSTQGVVIRDTVHFGRLSAIQQAINAATTVGGSFQNLYADGLLGLGYPALSSSGLPSLPITLQSQRIINPSLFAFRLSSVAGVSQLSVGSVNTAKYTGSFTLFPIAKDPSYNVFTYFQIGNSVSNTLIISPLAQAKAFWAAIPNSAPLAGSAGYYTFPCTQPLSVSFSFGGTTQLFAIDINDFNLGYIDSPTGNCVGALVGQELGIGSSTILGDVFLKSWYTSYNMGTNQVGLATPV